MAKKPTISEIKRKTENKSPYFFDRKSMKVFGQTMRDFKVYQTKSGSIYIYAKMKPTDYRTGRPRMMGYTIRQFIDKGMNSELRNVRYKTPSELPL
jgi:hypothetical protein